MGAAIFFVAGTASAEIFSGTDEDGVLTLSNHPNQPSAVVLIADPTPPPIPPVQTEATAPSAENSRAAIAAVSATPPNEPPIDLARIIRDAALDHAVPHNLLAAMVAVESGFDTRAVSPKGAKGLMQLMPETARRFGVKDAFAADQNVRAGAAYMRALMNQFPESIQLALAAYNAGEGAVLRAGRRVPAFAETRSYVHKVLARVAMLSKSSVPASR